MTRVAARALAAALVLAAARSGAAGVADVLRDPRFAHLELAPIATALASTVASTYPVASASSSVVYAYNPELDTLERRAGVAGPIIGERAETIGRGRFDVVVAYSWVHLASIDGEPLDRLVNRRRVNGQTIIFPVPGGLHLADGRVANFLPVRVTADLDVEAHVVAPSVTYGLTPDLDVNVTLPLLRTSLDVTARTEVPDPRFPRFALAPGDPNARHASSSLGADAFGAGDLLLRTKYVFLRSRWVDAAAQLGLSLPTGNEEDLAGTGTTRVQPTLVLSHAFADRVEPLLNVGVDCDADDAGASVVRWAVGGTVRILDPLTGALVFLGRHELAPQGDRIATPFFFQLRRNDQYDASAGVRWTFGESASIAANALVPLNEEGFRADVIPTVELDYAF